jgi:hypothetical protein
MSAIENLKLIAGASKPPIGIVPMHALFGVARVLEDSGCKYAPGNFMAQSVSEACESYDSAQLRHRIKCTPLSGLATPESYAALDDDSGLPHIDHMISGLLILRTLMIRDGVLPEDPGQGKRKQNASAPKITGPDDPGYRAAAPIQIVVTDPATIAQLERGTHAVSVGWSTTAEGTPTPSAVDDLSAVALDEIRRAVVEENIKQLEAEQRAATQAKRERDEYMAKNAGRTRAEGMRW